MFAFRQALYASSASSPFGSRLMVHGAGVGVQLVDAIQLGHGPEHCYLECISAEIVFAVLSQRSSESVHVVVGVGWR